MAAHTPALNLNHEKWFLNVPVADPKLLHHQESMQCAYRGASLQV